MFGNVKYFAATLLIFLLLSGCGPGKEEHITGRVAVVDFDKIAAQLGVDKRIDEKISDFARKQQEDINALRDELRSQLAGEEKKIGKKPKQSEREKFFQLQQQAELKLRQKISQVEQDTKQMRTNLVQEFHKDVQPVAIRIANEYGYSIILIRLPSMLYADTAVDISNDVVEAMQGNASKAK